MATARFTKRKIIVSEMITVDGFFAGPNGEIDWHVVDAEFNEYAIAMLNAADTILFGRVTYDMMASYWPSPNAVKNDPIVAERMNSLAKVVFSKTKQADGQQALAWNNSKLMVGIVPEEMIKMKQQEGKDILVLGSGMIVSALTQLGLIDEYRLIVNPVILGAGKTLFVGIKNRIKLELVKEKKFSSGNVLSYYRQ